MADEKLSERLIELADRLRGDESYAVDREAYADRIEAIARDCSVAALEARAEKAARERCAETCRAIEQGTVTTARTCSEAIEALGDDDG